MKFMDLGTKTANELISKDFNTARSAAQKVVNHKDIETFKKLAQQSDFLFDFIKQKIAKNLSEAVNKDNYKNLLDFTHIYSADFEDFVVGGLVKFASEDLTDEMLELFEKGDNAQKAYCAAYFEQVKDPLCIEFLNKYAFSEFEPLANNCARALLGFGEKTLYNEMLAKLLGDAEDFEKFEALNFLVAYGDQSAFSPLVEYMKISSFAQNVAASILSLKPFVQMIEEGQQKEALEIFDNVAGAYPEVLSPSTIVDYNIFDFIKYIVSLPRTSYIDRIILKTMVKFELISQNDIYTFDLDKKTKELVGVIQNYLDSLKEDYKSSLPQELAMGGQRAQEALDVIYELNLCELATQVAQLVKDSSGSPMLLSEGIKTLKALDALDSINKEEVVQGIEDENILALIQSYFN